MKVVHVWPLPPRGLRDRVYFWIVPARERAAAATTPASEGTTGRPFTHNGLRVNVSYRSKALKLARNRGQWEGDVGAVLPVAFSPAYEPRQRALSQDDVTKLLAELPPDRAARV